MKTKIVIEFTDEEKEALSEAILYLMFKRSNATSSTNESRRLDSLIKALEGILKNDEPDE